MLHIIVQAGGRGSRLRHHTWNKPKCLVSIRGKPLLYHLFDRFPNAHFHIIGDYAYEQLERYLKINPPAITFDLIKTHDKGTCSGIAEALHRVPKGSKLIITWSDLIIHDFPKIESCDYPTIVTTHAFTCRWTVDKNTLIEKPGSKGVPGIFYIDRAELFPEPPRDGEFVKWFSKNINKFQTVDCETLEELGDFTAIENENDKLGFSRFFNEVKIKEFTVTKQAIDSNYTHLIEKEQSWYKTISQLGFRRVPKIISYAPYTLERINGQHAYQMKDLSDREKRSVLSDIINSLIQLHDLGKENSISSDIQDTYIAKTITRVEDVKDIIPNFDKKNITVNGRKCRNIFHEPRIFEFIFQQLIPKNFTPIHGDPTFSNSLIDKNLKVWFIDPRGYFSKTGIWGDPMYDFAKVYYSAVGGYDNFNRRKFKLHIDNDTVEILMPESPFNAIGEEIFSEYFGSELFKIKILHGLIWLSLSGYAKDDIDSIIASFYLGLYYLEEGLKDAAI